MNIDENSYLWWIKFAYFINTNQHIIVGALKNKWNQ